MRSKGVGLVELLIGVTLVSVAGILITGFLSSSNQVFTDQTAQVNQGLSLNQSNYEISNLIKASSGVAPQYPSSGIAQHISGDQVLVLKLPVVNGSGNVIEDVYDYAVITREPGSSKILREYIYTNAQSTRQSVDKVLSVSLKSIKFSYFDSSGIQVTPSQAARINFIINLAENPANSGSESSSSGIVNLKNF